MLEKNAAYAIVFIILFSVFVILSDKETGEVELPVSVEEPEESPGTGILHVTSAPAGSGVYMDNEFRGNSPLTLYSIPEGKHKVLIRHEGYDNYESEVTIRAGKREELDIVLNPAQEVPVQEISKTKETTTSPGGLNKSSIGDKLFVYYDFDNALFTNLRSSETDVFSRNYKSYLHFTSINPAKIGLLKKPISDASIKDCENAEQAIAKLSPGDTLCIRTGEGKIAALGGNWQETNEIEWIIFD